MAYHKWSKADVREVGTYYECLFCKCIKSNISGVIGYKSANGISYRLAPPCVTREKVKRDRSIKPIPLPPSVPTKAIGSETLISWLEMEKERVIDAGYEIGYDTGVLEQHYDKIIDHVKKIR